ncbi:hypothetical protein EJ08DRAFT_646932 [Tothia fuscella]|uniref:Uncharacterized protein n=1 Tax=Tothia fuscella TaxID=1048955 RepID=A0A9P4U0X9_9PEZI|nr:hypothetical protein EJ08DRAFT_646932 [Tothia fuscella]
MSFNPNLPVVIEVAIGVERGTKFPHWMLMLRSENDAFGTWYHSTGGPTQNQPYKIEIQGHKRSNSRGIQSLRHIGTISPQDVKKVNAAAKRVPAQQCQRYVTSLVCELERKGMVASGTAQELANRVQMSKAAWDYSQQHPVQQPAGIHYPNINFPTAGPSRTNQSAGSGRRPHPQNPSNSPPKSTVRPANPSTRKQENSGGCCIVM